MWCMCGRGHWPGHVYGPGRGHVHGLGPDRGFGEGQGQLVIAAFRFRFWGSASCAGA